MAFIAISNIEITEGSKEHIYYGKSVLHLQN